MTYAEALEHLYALGPELALLPSGQRRKFDLDHMRTLCSALGAPQRRFQSVLIAGTNGKGSTAATLANICTACDLRTGLYTSPHLVRINERIQIADGATRDPQLACISDDDFARLYTLVDAACNDLLAAGNLPVLPSFFERVTAIAFLYFAENDVQIAVLEVGLGGRLDATNVVEPIVSVLTDIALDHQEYLGNTIAQIAREKCGILRPGGVLVTLSQHPEANQVIGEVATELGVRAINAAPYLPPAVRNGQPQRDRNTYGVTTEQSQMYLVFHLDGEHQQRNLALALATALELRQNHGFAMPMGCIESGVHRTRWPGRLERMDEGLLLDVAHNPAGAWTLRAFLSSQPPQQPRTLIFSCLRDKNLIEMSRILFPLFDSSADGDPLRRHDHILLAPIANPRAASVEDLLAAAHALGVPAHAAPHLAAALAQARRITPPGGLIVATGSVYLVGEIRELALAEMAPA